MSNINLIVTICCLLVLVMLILIVLIIINNSKHNAETDSKIVEIKNVLANNLLNFSNELNDDFLNLSDRINSNLIQSHKNTNEIFNNINEKIIRIDQAQKGIDELSKEVISLQSILTDKKARGTFGEIELYSLLENVYGINEKRYARQYHLPNGSICDAVIFAGDNLGLICIDSKFPLENYRRMYDENLSIQEKELARKQFKSDVKKHIDNIKNKYIIPGVTADLAYMFIPAEAVYAEILSTCDDIVDKSYNDKVYLVSPTTLMAYITAIKSIYLGQAKDAKAKEIQNLLAELSIEFDRFEQRENELYTNYHRLEKDFEQISITANKIIKKFEKIKSGEIE